MTSKSNEATLSVSSSTFNNETGSRRKPESARAMVKSSTSCHGNGSIASATTRSTTWKDAPEVVAVAVHADASDLGEHQGDRVTLHVPEPGDRVADVAAVDEPPRGLVPIDRSPVHGDRPPRPVLVLVSVVDLLVARRALARVGVIGQVQLGLVRVRPDAARAVLAQEFQPHRPPP